MAEHSDCKSNDPAPADERSTPPAPVSPIGEPSVVAQVIEDDAAGHGVAPVLAPSGSAVGKRRWPQPGLPLAVGLALAVFVTQTIAVIVVAMLASLVLIAILNRPDQMEALIARADVYLFPVGTLTTAGVAIGIAGLLYGRDAGRCIGWRGFSRWQGLALPLFVVSLSIVASEMTNVLADLLSRLDTPWLDEFRHSRSQALEALAEQPFWMLLLAGCLLPGVGEEILNRGVIGRGLVARHGIWRGGLLASAVFGLMHVEPVQAFGAFVLGLGLQYVFLVTRSLTAAMVVHAVNNALAFSLLRFQHDFHLPGLSSVPEGDVRHAPLPVLVLSLFTLLAAACWLFQSRTRWCTSEGHEWTPGYVSGERPPASVAAQAISRPPPGWLAVMTVLLFALLIAAVIVSREIASS